MCIYIPMKIEPAKAGLKDAQTVWEMRKKSFQRLLDTYRDYETNPGADSVQKIIMSYEKNDCINAGECRRIGVKNVCKRT